RLDRQGLYVDVAITERDVRFANTQTHLRPLYVACAGGGQRGLVDIPSISPHLKWLRLGLELVDLQACARPIDRRLSLGLTVELPALEARARFESWRPRRKLARPLAFDRPHIAGRVGNCFAQPRLQLFVACAFDRQLRRVDPFQRLLFELAAELKAR